MKNYIWIYKMRCSGCFREKNMTKEELDEDCEECGGFMEEINRWKKSL